MIRDIRRNGAQPKDTMHKAGVALVTGMGVVVKDATTVELPKAETVANIYVATKERIPTGINAARVDMSDYDEDFVKIIDFFQFHAPVPGQSASCKTLQEYGWNSP